MKAGSDNLHGAVTSLCEDADFQDFLMASSSEPNPLMYCAEDAATVELRGYSHNERGQMLVGLERAMASCGCWILEQRAVSPTQTSMRFEVQLRAVFELYSELVAAGVELTRDSHARLTELCTLRGHRRDGTRRRVVTVRLEVSFLEEDENEFGALVIGLA
jgi:hypothetical protein